MAIEIADIVQCVATSPSPGTGGATVAGVSVEHTATGVYTLTLDAPTDPSRQVWLHTVLGSAGARSSLEVVDETTAVLRRRLISDSSLSDGGWSACLLKLPTNG